MLSKSIKAVASVIDEYRDILKTENWELRKEKLARLKAYVRTLQKTERGLIRSYYPDLFTR